MNTQQHKTPFPPIFPKDLASAQRQYVEQISAFQVTNRYLRVAIAILFFAFCGALALGFYAFQTLHNFQPLVIRINDVGRAESIEYSSMKYKPQTTEIRYFLTAWAHDHFSRMRATVKDDFARSFMFLDQPLVRGATANKDLEHFIAGDGDEIEATVQNVVVTNLERSPFRAQVDFEKRFLSASDRSILKKERHTATVDFEFRPITNDLVPFNPLGLIIVQFHTYQAFSEAKP